MMEATRRGILGLCAAAPLAAVAAAKAVGAESASLPDVDAIIDEYATRSALPAVNWRMLHVAEVTYKGKRYKLVPGGSFP